MDVLGEDGRKTIDPKTGKVRTESRMVKKYPYGRLILYSGKTVFDIGCGRGDLLWRYYEAGALQVLGVDRNRKVT